MIFGLGLSAYTVYQDYQAAGYRGLAIGLGIEVGAFIFAGLGAAAAILFVSATAPIWASALIVGTGALVGGLLYKAVFADQWRMRYIGE